MQAKTKSLLVSGLFFLAFFGVSTGVTYYLMPQKVETVVDGDSNPNPSTPSTPSQQTHKDILINSLLDQAMGDGLSLTLDQATLSLNEKNTLKFDGAKVNLALGALNLHGIDLTIEAPVDYNSKQRSLELALLDDNIYFSISNKQDDGTNYDFKYKVSTASEDILDSDGNPQEDPTTGGILQYEYGKLDWVIEDILSILSDGEINVSFPSIGDALAGSSESTGSALDVNAILASMDAMKETTVGGSPYFQWDLEIAGLSLPIGLKTDAAYNLTGIDLGVYNTETGLYETASVPLAWRAEVIQALKDDIAAGNLGRRYLLDDLDRLENAYYTDLELNYGWYASGKGETRVRITLCPAAAETLDTLREAGVLDGVHVLETQLQRIIADMAYYD